jgi:hypothetical protein
MVDHPRAPRRDGDRHGGLLMRALVVAVLVGSLVVTGVLAAAIAAVARPPGSVEVTLLFVAAATGGWVLARRVVH